MRGLPVAAGCLAVLVATQAVDAFAAEPERFEPTPLEATIVYQDGRPEEKATVLTSGAVVWLAAQDVASIFRIVRFWRSDVRKLTFQFDGHEIVATVGAEVSVIDRTEVVHLDAPVLHREGRVYLPMSILLDPNNQPLPWLPNPVSWDARTRRLQVGGTPASVVAIELGSESRLDIVLSEPRDFRLVSTARTRFVVRIPRVTIDRSTVRVPAGSEHFVALTVTPYPEAVEVSFAASEMMVGYQVLKVTDPHRVSILLTEDERFVQEGRVEPFSDRVRDLGLDLRTIVIDPGHGGADAGARSAGGLRESDLTLALAREVALQLSERFGIRAVLTRDSDRDMTLAARVEMANLAGADLFLSLHYDSWPSGNVRGPRAVVARGYTGRNTAVPRELTDLGFGLWGDSQGTEVGKARAMAEGFLAELSRATGDPSRGVEEWPLPVLTSAAMPAVFLEVGALSAKNIDREFSERNLQTRIAEAIVAAVDAYRSRTP